MKIGLTSKQSKAVVVIHQHPTGVRPGDSVRFVVWVSKDAVRNIPALEMFVLNRTLEAFPRPKLEASELIPGKDGNYYCFIDLLDATPSEVARATLAFASIFQQIFGILPFLSPYVYRASVRVMEREAGFIGTMGIPFPIQRKTAVAPRLQ